MLQFRRFVKAIFQRILRYLKAAQSMDIFGIPDTVQLDFSIPSAIEHFHPMITSDFPEVAWSGYRFENRRPTVENRTISSKDRRLPSIRTNGPAAQFPINVQTSKSEQGELSAIISQLQPASALRIIFLRPSAIEKK